MLVINTFSVFNYPEYPFVHRGLFRSTDLNALKKREIR